MNGATASRPADRERVGEGMYAERGVECNERVLCMSCGDAYHVPPVTASPIPPPTPPTSCIKISPDSVYQVMLTCWEKESARRPTFAQCKNTLEDLMQNNFTHL